MIVGEPIVAFPPVNVTFESFVDEIERERRSGPGSQGEDNGDATG